MSKNKTKYNNCKEKGSIGERQEMVLRKHYEMLLSKIDPSKIGDKLVTVGILDPLDLEGIDTQKKQVKHIMKLVLDSGPDGFVKFMDALRAGGYCDLAAELEQQLEKTNYKDTKGESGRSKDLCSQPSSTSSESSGVLNGLGKLTLAFIEITQPQLSLNIGMSRTGNEPWNVQGSMGVAMFGGHPCFNKQLF